MQLLYFSCQLYNTPWINQVEFQLQFQSFFMDIAIKNIRRKTLAQAQRSPVVNVNEQCSATTNEMEFLIRKQLQS